jgi:hypothetical protein
VSIHLKRLYITGTGAVLDHAGPVAALGALSGHSRGQDKISCSRDAQVTRLILNSTELFTIANNLKVLSSEMDQAESRLIR